MIPSDIKQRLARLVSVSAEQQSLRIGHPVHPRDLGLRIEWINVAHTTHAIMLGALDLIERVRRQHGPGWVHPAEGFDFVHLIEHDDGSIVATIDGFQGCRLRALYVHRPEVSLSGPAVSENHAFVRGPDSGPLRQGPPEETCAVCQCDPRNAIHRMNSLYRRIGIDPLDVEYDGVKLRTLLAADVLNRNDAPCPEPFSRAQRTAISAHWSAELRAKVAAGAERERNRVLVDRQDEP